MRRTRSARHWAFQAAPRAIFRSRRSRLDQPPIVKSSVIRVVVEHLSKPSSPTKKTLWLWRSVEGEPDLERCWRAYLRRFDIDHMLRHVKRTLGRTAPKLAMAEQADRWDPARRRRIHRAASRAWPRPDQNLKSTHRDATSTQGLPTVPVRQAATDGVSHRRAKQVPNKCQTSIEEIAKSPGCCICVVSVTSPGDSDSGTHYPVLDEATSRARA